MPNDAPTWILVFQSPTAVLRQARSRNATHGLLSARAAHVGATARRLVHDEKGTYDNDAAHAANFLDCMRTRAKPSADLETIGHPSSLLCHFGNSAWRTGRTFRFNYDSYTFGGDAEANKYLVRPEHRKPWTLPTLSEV